MDSTPLLGHLRQVLANRSGDPCVSVGDDELDARESALEELREEVAPRILGLLRADGHAEKAPVTVRAHSVGHQRRNILNDTCPARIEKRGVEEEIRDRVGDGRIPQLLDLRVERLVHTAYCRPARRPRP